MANFHKSSSPYSNTNVKDFYLDLWNPVELTPQDDDIQVVITGDHHQRPDKFSYYMYGTPNLFWVFWMRNKDKIIDPIEDFRSGTIIYAPSKSYVQRKILK